MTRAENGQLKHRWTAKNTIWIVAFWSSLLLLLNHLLLGSIEQHSFVSSALKALAVGLLYMLFLLEGLLVAGTQIKSSDHGGVDEWIAKHVPAHEQAKAIQLSGLFRTRFDDFVAGRQISVMLVVVAFALILETLEVSENSMIAQYLTPCRDLEANLLTCKLKGVFHQIYFAVSDHSVANLLLAALIPCWLSQLLPQHLADSRSFEFVAMPLSGNAVRVSMLLANLGAGRPVHHLAWLMFNNRGRFMKEERFSVGPETIFTAAKSTQDYYATHRRIEIFVTEGKCEVTDSTAYCFSQGATPSIVHSIRTAQSEIVFKDFNIECKVDIPPPEPHAIEIVATRAHSDPNGEPVPSPTIYKTIVLANTVSFAAPLPRAGFSHEEARATVRYETPAPPLAANRVSEFAIDVSRLTRRIEVIIHSDENLIVLQPSRAIARLDAISLLGGAPSALMLSATPQSISNGWRIEIDYPETGSEITIGLDVRKRA